MTGQSVRGLVIAALRKVTEALDKSDPSLRLDDPTVNPPLASLGLDSLDAVEWCMEIETRTGVELDPADLAGLATLNDVSELIAARLSRAAPAVEAPQIERVSRDAPLVLSFAQEAIWRYSQTPETCGDYAIGVVDRILGPLDPAVLCDCLDYIVRRHEILRTSFDFAGGQPVQIVHPPEPLALPMLKFPPGTDPKEATAWLAKSAMAQVVDLRQRPLLRFVLLNIGPGEHWLLRLCHHIIWDEWSAKILIGELSRLYQAKMDGSPRPLPESEPLQYADYAAWQRRTLGRDSAAYQDAVGWWKKHYATLPPPDALPFLRPSPQEGLKPEDGVIALPVDAALAERVSRLSQREGATVYTVWLAALAALLSAETGQLDAVVGSYMTNRRRPQLQNMIGCFSNLAALRLRCDNAKPFRAWLSEVRSTAAAAEAHSDIPRELLRSELSAQGITIPDVGVIFGAPLAQSRVDAHFAGLTLARPDWPLVAAMPWGISINIHEHNGLQECRTTFDARTYDPAAIRRLTVRLLDVVDAVTRRADLPLEALLGLREAVPSPGMA